MGYLACGIIPPITFQEYAQSLDERIKLFPESKELYENLCDFVTPPKEAKSIIVCTLRYNQYKIPASLDGLIGKSYLFDARLSYAPEKRLEAEFEEYLKLLGINILQCGVPDRLAAAKAGLGKFGRNNFIYDNEHGSYIVIGTYVVDKELDYDPIAEKIVLPQCSDNCERCVKSCPTKALSGGFKMNRGKCVTQINCYAKNILDRDTRTQMGSWLYGCDACQDACPVNNGKLTESSEFPLLKEYEEYLKPENLLEMDENTFANIVYPRFWYIGTDKLWLWKCNVLRYMMNSGDGKYRHLIEKYSKHEDERIREVAQSGY